MLSDCLNFGMCSCSEIFIVMYRCYTYASVIFVDFSEYFC